MNNNSKKLIKKEICFIKEIKVLHRLIILPQKMNCQWRKLKSNLNFLANMKKNH